MSFKLQFEKLQSKLDTKRAILSLPREDKLKLVKEINFKRDKKTNYFDLKKINSNSNSPFGRNRSIAYSHSETL